MRAGVGHAVRAAALHDDLVAGQRAVQRWARRSAASRCRARRWRRRWRASTRCGRCPPAGSSSRRSPGTAAAIMRSALRYAVSAIDGMRSAARRIHDHGGRRGGHRGPAAMCNGVGPWRPRRPTHRIAGRRLDGRQWRHRRVTDRRDGRRCGCADGTGEDEGGDHSATPKAGVRTPACAAPRRCRAATPPMCTQPSLLCDRL